MCFMCGDDMNLSYLLTPLLSHQCCFVTSDKFPTITLETYLGDSKRKVEVVVTSYHGASVIQDSLYHGFILVYSAKRKASLRTMGSVAVNSLKREILLCVVRWNSHTSDSHSQPDYRGGLVRETG